jgi:hypothetical protein
VRTLALVSMTAGVLATFVAGAAGAGRLVPGGALPGQREATYSTRGLITHLAAGLSWKRQGLGRGCDVL